jgi:hypothetical protein
MASRIIDVLAFSIPTGPMIGTVRRRDPKIPFIVFPCFSCSDRYLAKNTIKTTLDSSDGWNDTGPRDSHRFEPFVTLPIRSVRISRKLMPR